MLVEFTVFLLAVVVIIHAFQIGTLKERLRTLEVTVDDLTKRQYIIKIDEEGYNPAIDPYPETPEEHDYLVRLHKEGEL